MLKWKVNPEDKLTDRQREMIFSHATGHGITTDEVRAIANHVGGYTSIKDIKIKDVKDILTVITRWNEWSVIRRNLRAKAKLIKNSKSKTISFEEILYGKTE